MTIHIRHVGSEYSELTINDNNVELKSGLLDLKESYDIAKELLFAVCMLLNNDKTMKLSDKIYSILEDMDK